MCARYLGKEAIFGVTSDIDRLLLAPYNSQSVRIESIADLVAHMEAISAIDRVLVNMQAVQRRQSTDSNLQSRVI